MDTPEIPPPIVPLRDYVDTLDRLRKEYVDTLALTMNAQRDSQLKALDEKMNIALAGISQRFESSNQIREAMRDQSSHMATKGEVTNLLKALETSIMELRESRPLLLAPIERNVQELREWKANMAGMATQDAVNEARSESSSAKMFAVIGVIGMVFSILLSLAGIIMAVLLH